tara:strand:- start:2050 stop:2340 length:291 start_codon:yes stop_codon:yes gene_type:complete
MLTIIQMKSQLLNLITMIVNKDRKTINKWKKDNDWFYIDDGVTSDIDTIYYLCHRMERGGELNTLMDYINIIDTSTNNFCKWKSIKKKNEFFNTFI